MSATFNVELFANYFSKKSVEIVERVEAYKGVEERYVLEAKQNAEKLANDWGPAKLDAWNKLAKKEEIIKDELKSKT
jgi:hypothetical protein